MRAWFRSVIATAIAGALTISCAGIIDPSKNLVESYGGTVAPGQISTAIHMVTVSKTGEYTVKITALSPVSSAVLGIDMAFANNDGACTTQLFQRNQFATLNQPALSGQILSGKYCVVVYDIGALTVTATYTLTVSHP